METKPKIDIETLRIEAREDDLSVQPRSYHSYIYTLRDDKRIFAHGDFSSVNKFLIKMFGLDLTDSNFIWHSKGSRHLKQDLFDFYTSPMQQFNTVYKYKDGWQLAKFNPNKQH